MEQEWDFISKGFLYNSRSIDGACDDGASRFHFPMIIMPLAKPIIVAPILRLLRPVSDYILSSYILGDVMQHYKLFQLVYK